MQIHLDGRIIRSEADFHDAVGRAFGIEFYGRNLDALWDALTALVEPPIDFRWTGATASREAMGARFDRVIEVLREAEASLGPTNFRLEIEA